MEPRRAGVLPPDGFLMNDPKAKVSGLPMIGYRRPELPPQRTGVLPLELARLLSHQAEVLVDELSGRPVRQPLAGVGIITRRQAHVGSIDGGHRVGTADSSPEPTSGEGWHRPGPDGAAPAWRPPPATPHRCRRFLNACQEPSASGLSSRDRGQLRGRGRPVDVLWDVAGRRGRRSVPRGIGQGCPRFVPVRCRWVGLP
jgi:hypothetical protein